MKKDLVVSLILLAASIALYASLSLMEDPAAASFPRVVIVIMGCLGLVLLIKSLLIENKGERPVLQNDRVVNRQNPKNGIGSAKGFPFGRLIGLFLLILVYFAVMETLGFYISAFLFFAIILGIFNKS